MTNGAVYRIQVGGRIGERWMHWFDEMEITSDWVSDDSPITTLTGISEDQAALRGVLNKIWDLNLTLLSVTRIEMDSR
jgi:hypothetical protein